MTMLWLKAFLKSFLLLGIVALSFYAGVTLTIFVAILPFMASMAIILPFLPIVLTAFIYLLAEQILDIFTEKKSLNQSFWPRVAHWQQGIRAMIVLVVATAFSVASTCALFLLYGGSLMTVSYLALWTPDRTYTAGYELGRFLSENQILLKHFVVVWLTGSTCLYKYDDWAIKQKQRRQKLMQRQQVAKVKDPPTPVDVISVELNQMKGSMGITKMGSVRQKSADKPKKTN
jgi:hypothetical protein